jgi:hypothetical protein
MVLSVYGEVNVMMLDAADASDGAAQAAGSGGKR